VHVNASRSIPKPSANGVREDATIPTGPEVPTVTEHLARLLAILRRRYIILVVMTVVAALVAGTIASTSEKQYAATSKVLLSDAPIVRSTELNRATAPGDPEREVNTQISLIRIGTVADAVRARLHLSMSRQALTDKVHTSAVGTTNIVNVTAKDSDPKRAAAIANGFARQYVAFRDVIAQSGLREAATRIRAELAALDPADNGSARGRGLRSRLHELEIASASETGGAEVVLVAAPPFSASGPSTLRSALIGAVLGLLVALGVIALLELLSPTPRDRRPLDALRGSRRDEGAVLISRLD